MLYPYPDIAAEFPEVEVTEIQPGPAHYEENENDENEEAAASEQNCDFGELPMRNGMKKQEDGTHIIGNLDEPEMQEIIEEPVNNVIPEDVIELEDKIGNPEAENLETENKGNNVKEI